MSSRTLHIDKIRDLVNTKDFFVEDIFSSPKERFIIIRHLFQGFRSVICVHPRYTIVTDDPVISLEIVQEQQEQSLYEPLQEDDSMYKDTIKISQVNLDIAMEIQRYKKCLSQTQAFGIFFWGHGFIANVWYDHFTLYKTNVNPKGDVDIYSMIGVDNLTSWTTKTTENLQNIVPKFFKILDSVNDANGDSVEDIMKQLRKLKEKKIDLKQKASLYITESVKITEMLKDIQVKIENDEKDIKTNSGLSTGDVFRNSRAKDRLEDLYKNQRKLFDVKDLVSSKLSSIYYNIDSVIYFTRKGVSELQKILAE